MTGWLSSVVAMTMDDFLGWMFVAFIIGGLVVITIQTVYMIIRGKKEGLWKE